LALKKVINSSLDSNLNSNNLFSNITSQTVFSFGNFSLDTNLSNRKVIDYTNTISSFAKPITFDDLSISDSKSASLFNNSNNVTLNLDYSDLKSFVRYGSTSELLRVSIQNIILKFPASLYANNQTVNGGNITFYDYSYNAFTDTTIFKIPSQFIENRFGFVFNEGNTSQPDNNILKNLNLSYSNYSIWTVSNPNDFVHNILSFTGDSNSRNYIRLNVKGNPFPTISGITTTGNFNLHLKPSNSIYNDFILNLSPFEKYIISNKSTKGYIITLKDMTLLENGQIMYSDNNLLWPTRDGYNIDFSGYAYTSFLNILLNIGGKYDSIKTDLIARFLTPASIKTYDLSSDGKMTKLLRIYGREFDNIRQFIDSLVYINRVSYNKKNNIPDQLVKNLANTMGWNVFSLISEEQIVESFFSTADKDDPITIEPAEIDIELWRRILINTNYFWKSKGTREAIRSMLLLIGIPEPFINITEYIYTVDSKINPNTVSLTLNDLPSASLPYDNDGYPVAPIESNSFYFQTSGDSDNGQAYMNNFRRVGFQLNKTVDNKKSWVVENNVYRSDDKTHQYYVKDERLILNTKEVDINLDLSQGIENDVYNYIKDKDFPINSSGFTMPYAYVNLSAGYSGVATSFLLPNIPIGDVQVSFNGIDLSSYNTFNGTNINNDIANADYYINPVNAQEVILLNGQAKEEYANQKDVVIISYVYKAFNILVTDTIKYVVTRINPNLAGTTIPLPDVPNGDIQLTINGVALAKNRDGFNDGDFNVAGNIITIQNPTIIAFLASNPVIQVAYIISNNSNIRAKSEVYRIDTLNSSKLYFNNIVGKYVFHLNYKTLDASNIRLLVNGITLEPKKDYILNPNNNFELYISNGLRLGDVITAYYLIGNTLENQLIIDDSFGLGDITKLSFLEFIELIQRKLINAKSRKIITDFKGGFYPELYNVYVQYLRRSYLDPNDPLYSNGYTYSNIYSFLDKFNGFFKKFVDELLSATIILRKGGLLTRNTVFTRQKFMYRRGVSFDPILNYLGDNGTLYERRLNNNIYLWTNDFVCYNPPVPFFNQVYLYNIGESESTETYLYNIGESGATETYLFNNGETITGNTNSNNNISFDNFVTTTKLNIVSIQNIDANTKKLAYNISFNPSLPINKSALIKLRYNSILENNNIASNIVSNYQIGNIYKNNILLETYNNELLTDGVQDEFNTTTDISIGTNDILSGDITINTVLSGISVDQTYNTINEVIISIFEANIPGSIINIDNFNDELSVNINKNSI